MDAKTISRLTLTSQYGMNLLQYLEPYLDRIRLEDDAKHHQWYVLYEKRPQVYNPDYYGYVEKEIVLEIFKRRKYNKYKLLIDCYTVCWTKNVLELVEALKNIL